MPHRNPEIEVMRITELRRGALQTLTGRFGLDTVTVPDGTPIPGSHWGAPEAGLVMNRLYLRADTPVHSALHEACHYICMTPRRRRRLDTDAGGSHLEENGVCYLQILLADALPPMDRPRMLADMDRWGYSFRLGSAAAWFASDAEDARAWLLAQGLIDAAARPNGCLRV